MSALVRVHGYTQAMRIPPYCAAAALIVGVAGCGSQQPATAPDASAVAPPPPGMVPIHPTGTVVMPQGMSVGTAQQLTPTPELDARIAKLEKGKDKKALAAAYADRGYAHMTDSAASPRVMYRAALKDFRKALKVDPTNQKAKANSALIESIYRQMGRPIPTD